MNLETDTDSRLYESPAAARVSALRRDARFCIPSQTVKGNKTSQEKSHDQSPCRVHRKGAALAHARAAGNRAGSLPAHVGAQGGCRAGEE
ncbi:hypothetical protein D3C83_36680 [compost metagenome]